MAFELRTGDPSLGQSPRISFSHDIPQTGIVPVEQYVRSSSTDFDFCVFRQSFDLQDNSSSADELFLNGKILPIEIKRRIGRPAPSTPTSPPPPPPPPPPAIIIPPAPPVEAPGKGEMGQIKQQGSSRTVFWKIKRSSSLNCGSGYAATFCPLPLLSRSNSTGSSSPIPKRTLYNSSSSRNSSSSSSSRDAFNNPIPQNNKSSSTKQQKPPLMKSQASSGSNFNSRNHGVRITSVLNISASNLFGMGSMFSHGNGRDKNKKK